MTFSDKAKAFLKTHNTTAYQIARATGISIPMVRMSLTGERNMSVKNAAKVCGYLNIKLDEWYAACGQ